MSDNKVLDPLQLSRGCQDEILFQNDSERHSKVGGEATHSWNRRVAFGDASDGFPVAEISMEIHGLCTYITVM